MVFFTHAMDARQVNDLTMMAIMAAAGAILSCMAGLVVMSMAFGLPFDDFDEARDDPDFDLYTMPGPHWTEEIDHYGVRLNQTMAPICCAQYGEGQEWGDERK